MDDRRRGAPARPAASTDGAYSGRAHRRGGAGSVGATVAYACMLRVVADDIVLYDANQAKARPGARLAHGVHSRRWPPCTGPGDRRLRRSDVIVLAAVARQRPGQTRQDLRRRHARMCLELIPGWWPPRPTPCCWP